MHVRDSAKQWKRKGIPERGNNEGKDACIQKELGKLGKRGNHKGLWQNVEKTQENKAKGYIPYIYVQMI